MSSTQNLRPTKVQDTVVIRETEENLDTLTEPHPEIIPPSIGQIIQSESRSEPFYETYQWWTDPISIITI